MVLNDRVAQLVLANLAQIRPFEVRVSTSWTSVEVIIQHRFSFERQFEDCTDGTGLQKGLQTCNISKGRGEIKTRVAFDESLGELEGDETVFGVSRC